MIDPNFEPDNLDALIRTAMKSRPAPTIGIDLARVAMQKARVVPSDAALQIAARVNRWNRIATSVAVVLIAAFSAWIFYSRLAAGGFQYWISQTTTDTTTSTTASITTTEWMLAAGALAMGAVIIVLFQRAIASSDDWMNWDMKSMVR